MHMKSLIFAVLLIVGSLLPLAALDTASKVTVLNLYSQPIDVQIGDTPVLSILALPHGIPTRPQRVENYEAQTMYFKTNDATAWRVYSNANAQVLQLKFIPTLRYLILFDHLGSVSVSAFVPIYQDEARLAIANASQAEIKLVQIDSGNDNSLRLAPMPLGAVSRFASLGQGLARIALGEAGEQGSITSSLDLKAGTWNLAIIVQDSQADTKRLELWQLENDASLMLP